MPFASSETGQMRPRILSAGNLVTAKLLHLPTNLSSRLELSQTASSLSIPNISEDAGSTTNGTQDFSIDDPSLPSGAMSFVYFMYALTIFMTVLGNITVIVVFARGRRSRTDIRGFLVNLAVSDLIVGMVCLPFSSVTPQLGWIFPDVMCPLINFAQHMSVTASIYINAAIGIDRFLAVRFPFKRLTASRSRVAAIIAVIWISATGLASVQLFVSRAIDGINNRRECQEIWHDQEFAKHYSVILLVFTYIAPVTLVSIMYALVCQQLWSTNHPGAADALRDSRQLKAKRKVVKMLIIIVALFTVCWLPLHVFFLLLSFWPEEFQVLLPATSLQVLYYFVHLLAMSNSFQNPIIYGFLNDNFRSDLSEMLIQCCPFFSRFDAIQKAASRQHSSMSRHCSFRRQQSERCLMPPRRASVVSSAFPLDSNGSQLERSQLQPRRKQLKVSGMEFASSLDSSANLQPLASDPVNDSGLADALRLDVNDNSTATLLRKVMVLKNVLETPCNGTKPSRTSSFIEHDVIPEECSRNEEVAETMSFVNR